MPRNSIPANPESEDERLQRRVRFEAECAKIDPAEERAWSEIGLAEDVKAWPEY